LQLLFDVALYQDCQHCGCHRLFAGVFVPRYAVTKLCFYPLAQQCLFVTDFVPGKRIWGQAWCLLKDARAVKEKLNALQHEGDTKETDRWVIERRALVEKRTKVHSLQHLIFGWCNLLLVACTQNAQLLIQFLKSVEDEHGAEVTDVKKKREAECVLFPRTWTNTLLIRRRIESRLLKLGWQKDDFWTYERQRMRQWKSLVYTAKPLTERSKSFILS
jgi:hypothetical protein